MECRIVVRHRICDIRSSYFHRSCELRPRNFRINIHKFIRSEGRLHNDQGVAELAGEMAGSNRLRLRNIPWRHGAQLWQENSNFGLFQFKTTCLPRLSLGFAEMSRAAELPRDTSRIFSSPDTKVVHFDLPFCTLLLYNRQGKMTVNTFHAITCNIITIFDIEFYRSCNQD